MRRWILWTIVFAVAIGLRAQELKTSDAEPQRPVADYFSDAWLKEHVPQLLEKARTTEDGTAAIVLHRYPNNYMNLMVRVKTGVGEMHADWTDVLIALDGEANIITGGTLVDRKDSAGGESRGSRSEGGTDHIMHKGDVIHIMPGVAHWTVLQPGKNFVFFAVKIQTPRQGVLPVSQ